MSLYPNGVVQPDQPVCPHDDCRCQVQGPRAQGMRLAKQCRELLDGAELRITTLTAEFRAAGIGSSERMEP